MFKSIEIYLADVVSKQIGFRFITIDSYISAYKFYKKMRCKDAMKKEKVKNKLNEFKKLISLNKNKRAHEITIPLYRDLHENPYKDWQKD